MNINEHTLSPSTYQGDTRERLSDYAIVDTVTGTVLAAEGCRLVRHEYITDDILSSDTAIADLAEKNGIPLDNSAVN